MHRIKGCRQVGYYKHLTPERLATLNTDCLFPSLFKVRCQCLYVTVTEKKCLTGGLGLAIPLRLLNW